MDGESRSLCRLQSSAAHSAGAHTVTFLGETKRKVVANDTASSEGPDWRTSQGFSDQMGPERERKGASYKVRASSAKATVFLLAFLKGE